MIWVAYMVVCFLIGYFVTRAFCLVNDGLTEEEKRRKEFQEFLDEAKKR